MSEKAGRTAAAPLVIAEVAQAHEGSLGIAHSFIDAAAEAGAGAVKFQMHIADDESTDREPWRVRFSREDATRRDYWRRMEFTTGQWAGLREHCARAGVLFLASPFGFRAVEWLDKLEADGLKAASGEIGNTPLLERMAATGRPVYLSSGLSDWDELDAAVATVRAGGRLAGVFQCATAYPSPPERVGLNVIGEIRERYDCPTGLSDHSGTVYPGLAAVAVGAELLEVHLTFDRRMFGPDAPASLTVAELAMLVEGSQAIWRMRCSPVDKSVPAPDADALRGTFGRSVVAARDLPAGTVLCGEDLALKKPGGGVPPSGWKQMHGKRLIRSCAKDEAIMMEDLEEESQ